MGGWIHDDTRLTNSNLAMEDAHTTLLKLGDTNASFFGVFDGHGGLWFYEEKKRDIKLLIVKGFIQIRFNYRTIHWTNIVQKGA